MAKEPRLVQYRVLNPRDIPKGLPILSYLDKHYYVGEVFTPPKGMDVTRRLMQGFLEVVING